MDEPRPTIGAVRVLVVDDSERIRERLVRMIRSLGERFVISEAGSADEAMTVAVRERPNVTILDIRMPDGSGIDVLRAIKKERGNSIVVMLTNYPYPQYRKTCMDEGADFFFDKSTEFERVIEVVRGVRE